MNKYVNYSIEIQHAEGIGDKVHVKFSVKNISEYDLLFLKWNTPLEGIKSNLFKIIKGDYRVPYDGILIKRAIPTAKDYMTLESGDAISVDLEITDHYNIRNSGKYQIKLDTTGLNYFKIPKGTKPKIKISGKESQLFHLQTSSVSFKLNKGQGQPRKTLGGKFRKLLTGKEAIPKSDVKYRPKMKKLASPDIPNEPIFIGGNEDQRNIVNLAHKKALSKLQDCEKELYKGSPNTLYNAWFGKYAKSRYDKVSKNYSKIRQAVQSDAITYNLTGEGCQSSYYAYTVRGSRTIWICKAFWNAPDSGFDTKFGTIIHELSHAFANTDDEAYGIDGAKYLAKTAPADAIKNADNYEYFSESL